MGKVLRKSRYGYALGVVLFLIGISAIICTFWRVWLETGSFNEFLAAFWNILWKEEVDLVAGISFKLIFLFILGMTAQIFSALILAFSRKWFVAAGEKFLSSALSAREDGEPSLSFRTVFRLFRRFHP